MTPVTVAGLQIFPIKALDPRALDSARLLPSGCLRGDRRFALIDEKGNFLNGKRERRVHLIRVLYEGDPTDDDVRGLLWFGTERDPPHAAVRFVLPRDAAEFAARISNFLNQDVRLIENSDAGFPDDTDASGPTLISTETLVAFGEECGLSLEQLRGRFRANIEVVGGGAHWEDAAYGPAGTVVPLRVGEANLRGNNPCRRCVVPSRDPWTGGTDPGLAAALSKWRARTLGPHVARDRFGDNYFRLALNTRPVPHAEPRTIEVGDPVEILGPPIPLEGDG